jgi:hypothetical protein
MKALRAGPASVAPGNRQRGLVNDERATAIDEMVRLLARQNP